jgi:hypothetical protein
MAYWTPVQVNTVSASELFHFAQIIPAKQVLSLESWNWLHRTFPSLIGCTPGQFAGATVLPAIYCKPANLNRIYNRNICNDTAVLATDSDPGIASQKLQTNLDAKKWFKN